MKTTEIGFLASKKPKQIKISNVLVVQPPRRDSTDVVKWRNAIKAADRGRRFALVNLLEDLLLDPVLEDAVNRRIRKITNNDITFQSDGEEIEEMADFIDSLEFEKLLREIVLTKAFGKSVIELNFDPSFSIFSVPRQNLDTLKKIILPDISLQDGILYENDPFLLNLGDDKDLGFLTRVAPYVIFKRNGGADYAQFCELWGIPILAGMYDPEDETGRTEMEEAMRKRGAGGSVVMSKNGDLKPLSTNVNGAVHTEFLEWLDSQILIGVLGQTMTTKDGSSLSQSQVHERTEEDIAKADRIYVQRILNTFLVPMLEKRGFPVKNGFFKFIEQDNTPLKEKLNIALAVNKITEDGVDDDYFYNTFGLPRGKKSKEPEEENTEEEEEKKKKEKKVTAEELSFFNRLKDFFSGAPR